MEMESQNRFSEKAKTFLLIIGCVFTLIAGRIAYALAGSARSTEALEESRPWFMDMVSMLIGTIIATLFCVVLVMVAKARCRLTRKDQDSTI